MTAIALELDLADLQYDAELNSLIEQAGGAEKAALKLVDKIAVSFFWIGGLVFRLHTTKAHVRAGYSDTPSGFVKYMQDTIGLSRRKSYVLPRIYRIFRQAGMSAEGLKGLGWRKCEVLSRLPVEELRNKGIFDRARRTRLSILEKEIKAPPSMDPRMVKRRERTAREKAELEAARDHREPKADLDSGNLNETIAGLKSENKSLLEAFEREHQKVRELEQQIPVIAQNEDNPGAYLILNFSAEQKDLFNRVVRHATKLGPKKDDIGAFWNALQIYDELIWRPKNPIQKEQAIKRLASILGYYNETEEEAESNLKIKAAMYGDVSRGIDAAKGHSWGSNSLFWQEKTRELL